MPKRIDLNEGGVIEISGVPVVIAVARGKRVTLGVAVEDADGFVEEPEDLKRWAARFAAKIDNGG